MNLGIVIAVSEYNMPGSNLPGCIIDGKVISTILKVDNKFDDVLVINEKTGSADVKDALIEFITRHKNEEIQDVVFYFTGHGDFDGDEFYYLLSDFDKKRKKQTSLENAELDNLIKTLNPINAIKIVDACHSGAPYIKDTDTFKTYLKGTKGRFNKCYFMYSSQADQSSYQSAQLSYFTKSIVDSVVKHSGNVIRYKDIIDYVSDSFADNLNQTPFFVVQADFTEPFCNISETLKSSIISSLDGNFSQHVDLTDEKKTILELIKAEAQGYCDEKEAISILTSFLEKIKVEQLDHEIRDIYRADCFEESDSSKIPDSSAIGKWLTRNDHKLFAKAITENKTFMRKKVKPARMPGIDTSWLRGLKDDGKDYETVKETMQVTTTFRSTVDLPVVLLKVIAEPIYPNVTAAAAYIVPLISKTGLQVFVSFDFFDEQGWNQRKSNNSLKWTSYYVDLKDESKISQLAKNIINNFSSFLLAPLYDKFNLKNDEDIEEKE